MRRTPVPHRFDVALALRRRPRHRRGAGRGGRGCSAASPWSTVGAAGRGRRGRAGASAVPGAGRHRRPRRRRPARRRQHPASSSSPRPLVPDGALTALPDDGRLAEPVYAGEVVREERLAPTGRCRPWRPACPPGTRAMADPGRARHRRRPLVVGDRVDVLVALAAGGGRRRPTRLRARHRRARRRRQRRGRHDRGARRHGAAAGGRLRRRAPSPSRSAVRPTQRTA